MPSWLIPFDQMPDCTGKQALDEAALCGVGGDYLFAALLSQVAGSDLLAVASVVAALSNFADL